MNIPTDTAIERIIADATYIAERSKHPLAWHAVQQLQQLRAPLHTAAERRAAYDAVAALYTRRGFSNGDCVYEGVVDDMDCLMLALERYLDSGDPIVAEARAFGYGAVEMAIAAYTAIDQAHEYESLDYALYCHHLNACDTLREVFSALHGDGRFDDARNAIDAGFNAALAERGLTYNG